jgi:small subunit ribosomal protein S15
LKAGRISKSVFLEGWHPKQDGVTSEVWYLTIMLATDVKKGVIDENRVHDRDTGSPEVQVALLTSRIQELTGHLQSNIKDHSARRGLLKMVGRRSALLKYLTATNRERYRKLISRLGLRK